LDAEEYLLVPDSGVCIKGVAACMEV